MTHLERRAAGARRGEASAAGSTFECRLDGTAFAARSIRSTFGLVHGAHFSEVRAINPAGNVDSAPASYGWRVS